MKIATWNVNSINVRLEAVLNWLEQYQPDVLALQETKVEDAKFPLEAFQAVGYQAVISGQKTYNGVALLSKMPASDIEKDFPSIDDHQRRILAATINGVRILNLYIPNGSEVGSEKFTYKLEWLQHLKTYLQAQSKRHERFVIVGDFNIAPQDIDVHEPALWADTVLCAPEVRDMFQQMLALGFVDVFRALHTDAQYSWWDYRQAAFRRNMGLRIDHILANTDYATRCISVEIDKVPRKLERPSDHTPVIAQFS